MKADIELAKSCEHSDRNKVAEEWMDEGTVYCRRMNEYVSPFVCRECPHYKRRIA